MNANIDYGVTVYYYRDNREIRCGCADNRDAIRMCLARNIQDFRLVYEKQVVDGWETRTRT